MNHAVDGVSFELNEQETLAIAGESGCGKSTTAYSILRLLPANARIISGEIFFDGANLLEKNAEEIRKIRWKEISLVFQGALNALNPLMKVGDQVAEPIIHHKLSKKNEAFEKVAELFKLVKLDPERIDDYPHELSGGMKQRVVIAMALACSPKMVIADEPISALDVMLGAQIMALLNELKKKLGLTLMFITHDLPVSLQIADKVAIMYSGRIVEYAGVDSFLKQPTHPYSIGLMNSIPSIDGPKIKLQQIPGTPPHIIGKTTTCRFADRCSVAKSRCQKGEPDLHEIAQGHYVACYLKR